MNAKKNIWALFLLAATTAFSAQSVKVPEHVTLETIRELVAQNEKLINPIKMNYTNKKSRKGERQLPTGGARTSSGRRFSHSNCIWAQDGEKHYARVDYFYGPNEPAGSTAYVFDNQVTIIGKPPELMQGHVQTGDTHDWYHVMVAKLGLRPFEGRHRLSEILVPEYASLHDEIEMLDGRQTYVVDAKRPTYLHYFARIWIDKQWGMPLRINYYEKHPAWEDAELMGEVSDIELYQLQNGAWFPVKGLRTINFSDDEISYEHISVDVNSIRIQREDIPKSFFEIDFPDGAMIYNAMTGLTTIKGLPLKTYEQIVKAAGSFIAGTVMDVNGIPIPEVVVRPMLVQTQLSDGRSRARIIQPHEQRCAVTDTKGRFAIELEQEDSYELRFFPKNFVDTRLRDVPFDEHNLKVMLEKGGTVTGRAVRIEKGLKVPVADMEVSAEEVRGTTSREHRLKALTDSQGRFQIRYLNTQLPRRSDNQYRPRPWQIRCGPASENILFDEGKNTQEVELVLKPDPSTAAPLTGKKLPVFDGIKINLNPDQTQDRMMLICFFDMNQRPARNCIIQLNKQAEQLKQQGVAVIGIQAAEVDTTDFNQWLETSDFDFPIGFIEGDPDEIKFNWSIQSLPWLILTDKQHIVRAEGFNLDELDEKISVLRSTTTKDEKEAIR